MIMKKFFERYDVMLIIGIVLLVLAFMFGGCTRTIYVPVENTRMHTDSAYTALIRVDTVIDRDTIQTYIHGDTVMIGRIRWRIRTKEHHDTVTQLRVDSVYREKPYPVEVVREVVKPLRWWQLALMWLGGISLAGIVVSLFLCLKKR